MGAGRWSRSFRAKLIGADTMTPGELGLHDAAYSIKGFARKAAISVPTIYREIKKGRLRLTKLGRKSLILAPDAFEFLSGLKAEQK